LINKEFAWRFGEVTECASTKCRTILPKSQCNNLVTNVNDGLEVSGGEDIFLVRRPRKMKEYIPEKFTYFWPCESPFSQHFKCEFVINGRLYNCTKKWMMQQKCSKYSSKIWNYI